MVFDQTSDIASDRARATAQDLALRWGDRAARGEELRQLPPETVAELRSSGLVELLVPRRWGGEQADPSLLVETVRELGRGCGSSAWIAGFYMVHSWILSLFDEQAQADVFAGGPVAFAAGPFAPNGRAVPVDGGYQLTGRWSWASGIEHADWVLVGALVDGDTTLDAAALLLVPRADVQVEDVWHTSGMRATGSNDVVIDAVFVPGHRRLSFLSLIGGTTPGAELHDDATYRWPMVPILALCAAAPALGMAARTIDDFRSRLGERVLAYTFEKQATKPAARMRLAQATVRLAAVDALVDRTMDELASAVATGVPVPRPLRARARLVAAHAVHEARLVIQLLCEASGGSAHFSDSPFQRALRDVNTLAGHVIFDYDSTTELAGSIDIGADVSPTALV